MGKSLKKILAVAAPILGTLAFPGIGTAIGSALGAGTGSALALGGSVLGAGGGLLSGGGLKGAISGGLGGAALGGGGSLLGNAANSSLGLGLGSAGSSALGTGLLGAGAGGASGGLKGAALGGLAGGLGGYATAGGFDGLGSSLGLTGENSLFGTTAGTPLSGSVGPTQGSGVLGSLTNGSLTGGSLTGVGNSGGGMSSFGGANAVGNLLSGLSSTKANDDAEKALLAAQGRSLNAIQPYLNAKFEPGDLTQDPGYQFRLQQGQQAMDRTLGARGSLFSGAALKASQDYGQGLADSTYNDAYQRFLAQNQQNIGAAGMAGNIFDNQGNIQAGAGINNSNVLNKTASGLFGNGAFGNQGQTIGANAGGLTPQQIQMLLAQNKSASSFGF